MTEPGSATSSRVGAYRPPRISSLDAAPPSPELVARLIGISGLSSAFSDALDEVGLLGAVPASRLMPLRSDDVRIGRAITVRYLPMRAVTPEARLAHFTAAEGALEGDILVISTPSGSDASVLGGRAAVGLMKAGVRAVVVDGAVRDLDEIDVAGLATWSTKATPITGRGRLDAVEINGPVEVCGVQVVAGDIVVADRSGVTFVPGDRFEELAAVVIATA
jgi:regulator of RNase E activity RraA